MKKLLLFLLSLPMLASAVTIYMAGDSTMAKYVAKRAPSTGWGVMMQDKCIDGVKVVNRGISGASSKTYRTPRKNIPKRRYWDNLIKQVKKGDYVIIQFGHNDATKGKGDTPRYAYTDADTEFQTNLKGFIDEVRAKGATPILCTPTVICRVHRKSKAIYNTQILNRYSDAVRKVAAETQCDLIDINSAALKKLNDMGVAEAEKLYMLLKPGEYENYPNGKKDRAHLNDKGAEFYASLFVELAKAQKLPIAELFK